LESAWNHLAAELVLPSLCVADLSHFFRFASRIAFGKAIPECYAESWMKPWAENAIATIRKPGIFVHDLIQSIGF